MVVVFTQTSGWVTKRAPNLPSETPPTAPAFSLRRVFSLQGTSSRRTPGRFAQVTDDTMSHLGAFAKTEERGDANRELERAQPQSESGLLSLFFGLFEGKQRKQPKRKAKNFWRVLSSNLLCRSPPARCPCTISPLVSELDPPLWGFSKGAPFFCVWFNHKETDPLGPPARCSFSAHLLFFFLGGVPNPTKIGYRKRGTLSLTSLLEDLVVVRRRT